MTVFAFAAAILAADPNLTAAIETIRGVGKEGKGNQEALKAWKIASSAPAAEVTTLLAAFDGANPLAANYLHSAVDAVVQKNQAELPLDKIDAFLKEKSHVAPARRLAFDILVKADPKRKAPLLDSMLDDPAAELRRDAVQVVIDKAAAELKASKGDEAKSTFQKALDYARDQDQIESVVASLRKLGVPIDLAHQFGFLMQWKLVGPFENKKDVGWPVEYPPEKSLDFAAEYDGKVGKVKWQDHETDDEQGTVDVNKALKAKHKGAIVYAVAKFDSDKDQDVELRLGSLVAWKLWLNGEKLFERFESHAGFNVDQYKIPAKLKKGENVIVLKSCQNEQTEAWAQDWHFALRVSDSLGKAIHSTTRPPAKPTLGKPKTDEKKK
jgi:hypothetical protein